MSVNSRKCFDYIVIGCGGIGSATLYWLSKRALSSRYDYSILQQVNKKPHVPLRIVILFQHYQLINCNMCTFVKGISKWLNVLFCISLLSFVTERFTHCALVSILYC